MKGAPRPVFSLLLMPPWTVYHRKPSSTGRRMSHIATARRRIMREGAYRQRLDHSPDMANHPLVDDLNAMHQERLSRTERLCRRIADLTGAPTALLLAIVMQLAWISVGAVTRWDPFPFVFLLTCSNVLQLILIFVIAVAQKQQTQHDELRAESDHDSISRLLYH
jgi:uncharacterized membrane protein